MKLFFKIVLFLTTAIGFFWSHLNFMNIVFECKCKDGIFPKYYALPFVYKSDSLASSMAAQYFILGIFLNTIIVAGLFLFLDDLIKRFIVKNNKLLSKLFFSLKILVLCFSIFNIYISYTFLREDKISWTSDFRSQVELYKANCNTKFVFF